MARIPRQISRQVLPSGRVGDVPIPSDIADTGAGIEARGLGALGRGIGALGQDLFKIEQIKQRERDNASIADAISAENKLVNDEVNKIKNTVYASVDEINADRERLSTAISDHRDLVSAGMSERASGIFVNRSKITESSHLGTFENTLYRKELDLGRSKAKLNLGNSYEVLLSDVSTPSQKESAQESIDTTKVGYARYFKAGELELLEERIKISAYTNLGKYDQAIELASKTKAFTPQERESVINHINIVKRRKKDKQQIAREAYINETNKLTMDSLAQDINDLSAIEKLPDQLQSYWENKLVDRDKMIKAGNGDPFVNVYDPARYNSFRTIMEQDPKNLKESQITDAVGYGLTIDQGIDLVEKHRKLSRKDSPLTAPEAKRASTRISNAFEEGIIKHPDFIEGAEESTDDEYKNSVLRDRMLDELEEWLKEKPRTPEEIRKYTNGILMPYEEMESRNFINQVFHNIFSREAWVFSGRDYRNAIASLNKEAQAEWRHIGAGEQRHKRWGGVLPEDFIRRWQSPHKILTPKIARIYKKWAHEDLEEAKAMAQKDGWKEPK
jgi:hypothetical protein